MTMAATLQIFTRALQTPDLSFRTLGDARAVTDACGMPRLMRTTRFAEAEIEWHERRWLLALPLSPASLCMAERALLRIGTLRSEWITECRLLRGEMVWTGPTGTPQSCDLLLQHLPEGRSFDEALGCEGAERLLGELDALRGELRRLNLAHGNLHRGNIRWTGRRFVPIRYYDARFGAPERDDAAFEALREEILRQGGSPQAGDVEAPYEAGCTLTGHRWTSNLFEGLICVEDDAGYGYVDAQNRTVMYSKVPAGTYYFEVCAANNDGVWNNVPTVIKVVRKNAPWFSWYAYILYLLALASGIYFVYRHFSVVIATHHFKNLAVE